MTCVAAIKIFLWLAIIDCSLLFDFNIQETMEDITRLCPNTVFFCNNKSDDNPTPNPDVCCYTCDCTEDCFATGNCCFDKIHDTHGAFNGSGELYTVAGEKCTSTDFANKWELPMNYKDYMLVQTCPGNNSIDRCTSPDISNVADVTPVWSPNSLMNYRNRFCAHCNGETRQLQEWPVYFKCDTLLDFKFAFPKELSYKETLFTDLRDAKVFPTWTPRYSMYWEPPIQANNYTRTCLQKAKVVSICQDFLLTTQYLKRMCSSHYAPVKGMKGIYRNIFCRACNEDMPSFYACRGTPESSKNNHVFRLSLSAFMSPGDNIGFKGSVMRKGDQQCLGAHMHYILGECLNIRCPLTEILSENKCHPIVTHLQNMGLDYRFRFIYPFEMLNFLSRDKLNLAFHFVTGFNTYDKLDQTTLCDKPVLDIKMESSTVILEIPIILLMKKLTHIRDNYVEFIERIRSHNKRWEQGNEDFKVELSPDVYYKGIHQRLDYASYSSRVSKNCILSFAMSEIQYCESVVFSYFQQFDNGSLRIGSTMFLGNEYILLTGNNTSRVHMCLSTYIARKSNGTLKYEPNKASTSRFALPGLFLNLVLTWSTVWFETAGTYN